jgi:RNA polymerase sigma factor (sigma-70 family)
MGAPSANNTRFGEDAVLLSRWLLGDSDAAERLISRHVAALTRYFRSHQPADADDLLQDTLLALIEARARFRGESSFRTFLFSIARYTLWAHRRKQLSSRVILDDVLCDWAAVPANTDILPECEALDEALKRLSPELLQVITLALERQLSRDAIAGQLGIPPGTVASRMRLAKAQLKGILLARMAG